MVIRRQKSYPLWEVEVCNIKDAKLTKQLAQVHLHLMDRRAEVATRSS